MRTHESPGFVEIIFHVTSYSEFKVSSLQGLLWKEFMYLYDKNVLTFQILYFESGISSSWATQYIENTNSPNSGI